MLDLQKASAGSGKTYTLARQYLIFLLTISGKDGLRLRTREELEDSARHILAITFTNKATAEMKDRIVLRLSELADNRLAPKETVYLVEIAEAARATVEQVRQTAEMALNILLNNYSDFQVSTIDAFFQSILRTFAYEIGLSDTYGLEMDSDFIARSALDATLTETNSVAADPKVAKWFASLMEMKVLSKDKSWNLFAKSQHSGLYIELVNAIKKMAGEDFKQTQQELKEFFETHPNYVEEFKVIDEWFYGRIRRAHARMLAAARKAKPHVETFRDDLASHVASRIQKVLDTKPFVKSKATCNTEPSKEPVFDKKSGVPDDLTPTHSLFAEQYREMISGLQEHTRLLNSPEFVLWQIYRENLQYLPLMQMAAAKSAELLTENNVVDISNTNTILQRVIGDDDAPFIYERLGSRLDHYLIDEFQDTSAMQWVNLRPLVDESMGRGNGNLIIGDPKQSIYRFRNADPSLISTRVPNDFSGRVQLKGLTVAENTNYRSARTIVETNNTIFHSVSRSLDEASGGVNHFFADLYANTVQHPAHRDRIGYVELNFGKAMASETDIPAHFAELGPLIRSLLDRGYRQSDIVILTRKNSTGCNVVRALLDYNAESEDESPIDVVSEESLLIGASVAVKSILSVLHLLADGILFEEAGEPQQSQGTRRKITAALFECRCRLEQLSHPEMSTEEVMALVNSGDTDDAPLRELLASVGSLTLPALVEATAMRFVEPERRRTEAPYIAAFQDLVIDYCDRYSSDILSFLQWWNSKGSKASISSPEGTDAVNVMTVHKAKGLEYKCVIIPALKDSINPGDRKPEWRWIKPDVNTLGLPPELAANIPGILPVNTQDKMKKTVHASEYAEYMREYRMDCINVWYVAFTRAVNELYIFADGYATKSDKVSTLIANSLREAASGKDGAEEGVPDDLIKIETASVQSDGRSKKLVEGVTRITVGRPLTPEEIAAQRGKAEESCAIEELSDYFVSDPSDVLHYRDPEAGYRHGDDPDPRSLGNRLHDIMAHVFSAADLPRAVQERVVDGSLTPEEGAEALELLGKRLAQPGVKEWFRPGLRVVNERTVLSPGVKKGSVRTQCRPDRIIVDADGRATVIDYKFGEHRADSKYRSQVRNYMKLLRDTGRFTAVNGYVWYVLLDDILPVE